MQKNKLLFLALLVSKAIRVLIFLGLALLLIIFIHWHIDRDYYKAVQISVDNGSLFISEGKTETAQPVPQLLSNSSKRVYLNDLNPFSIYFTFLQICVTLVLSYFIVREVIRILKSVQELQPFNTGNITSFRRIGYLCFSVAALNCFRFLIAKQTLSVTFSVDYVLLIFMLITFILAEIFSEGQKLYEQDKLTI